MLTVGALQRLSVYRTSSVPAAVNAAESKMSVLPAPSVRIAVSRTHVPGSLNLGKLMVKDFVTVRSGGKRIEPLCFVLPDGPAKTASNERTPEKSSAAATRIPTLADPLVVSIAASTSWMLNRLGLTVSETDLMARVRGKPDRATPSASRIRVLPAASARNTELSVHSPASDIHGKFTTIEPDLETAVSSSLTRPPCRNTPDGLTKLISR